MKNLERSGVRYYLATPKDSWKDQTYFLHQIREEQLQHILFPLSDLSKEEVRKKAQELQLHVADKKDSVGICFVGDVDVQAMLAEKFGDKPGEVIDTKGNVIGAHHGLWFYTIGQRSGFTINQTSLVKQADGTTITKQNIPPFYVIAKKAKENQLVVGFGAETYMDKFKVEQLHWIAKPSQFTPHLSPLYVRLRHTGKLLPCKLQLTTHNPHSTFHVQLQEPQRGIAPGQFAVFYTPYKEQRTENGEQKKISSSIFNPQSFLCLGGGVITN